MLQSLLGQSPLSTTGGLIGLVGLVMIVLGLIFNKDEVWKAGIGIATAGSTLIGFVARDNATSVAAIKDIKSDHHANQAKIETLTEKVQEVPVVVSQAVKQEVAQKVIDQVVPKL